MQADLAAVLASIGSHGLPGAPDAVPGGTTIAPPTWERLRHPLRRRRVSGLAVAATVTGALALTDEQQAELAEIDRRVQGTAVRAERLTLELTADLASAGIEATVLKGPVTARLAYAEVAWRPFIDVDLLVRTDDLDATVARLERAGAERRLPQLRAGFDRRFGKSVTLRHPRGIEVDVHRTLVVGPLAQLVDVDDLWEGRQQVELVPGRRVDALHPDVAFLHACLHSGAGAAPGLLPARDVLGLAARADLERCAETARRWQATAVVQAAVMSVGDHGLPVPDGLTAWAHALEPTPAEQRVLRAYGGPGEEAGRLAATSWRYVRGLRGKVAYARALTFPSTANRSARQRSWARHAGRVLRRGRPGPR